MLVSNLYLKPKALLLTAILLAFFYAPNVLSNNQGTLISVVPLAMPNIQINPNAHNLVNNLIKDTYEQLRSAATSIVIRQNLTGIGVRDIYLMCQSTQGIDKFDADYVNCGRYDGEELPLRFTTTSAHQQLIKNFYIDLQERGDRYKDTVCKDNNLVSILYIHAQNFEDLIDALSSETKSLSLSLTISANVPGSGHEQTNYLSVDFKNTNNQWDYDKVALKAEVEEIAQNTYEKVLNATRITNSNGTQSVDGF